MPPQYDDSRWEHQRAVVDSTPVGVEKGLVIHYVTCPPPEGTESKGTILLVHGFPQTWYQFRHVITPLADAGYTVVAPDYRGAGASGKPWEGYTKDIMARDMHTLITSELGIKDKIHLVGHDIGGMIVHAYAFQYLEGVASICWGECPLLGSDFYHQRKHSMGGWHYNFHNVPDLPELLVQGKERVYLKHFYDRLSQNPEAISNDDLGVFAQAYAQPGALRCGFNCYRAFEEDAVMNAKWLQERGKIQLPCLSLWGGGSYQNEAGALSMLSDYYKHVSYEGVKSSGHWIAEEKPKEFVKAILGWVAKH